MIRIVVICAVLGFWFGFGHNHLPVELRIPAAIFVSLLAGIAIFTSEKGRDWIRRRPK